MEAPKLSAIVRMASFRRGSCANSEAPGPARSRSWKAQAQRRGKSGRLHTGRPKGRGVASILTGTLRAAKTARCPDRLRFHSSATTVQLAVDLLRNALVQVQPIEP
eukprot:9497038-Pyramimonas_sp.AAC.1